MVILVVEVIPQDRGIVFRDDTADDHWHVGQPFGPETRKHLRHQAQVRARQDAETDEMDALIAGAGHDLVRRQPDALVHHLHTGVAAPHRDLLGTVRVPI